MINATDLKNISIEDSSTIPSEWYFNKDIYELEKKAIFDKSWHLIGSQSRIPNCGDTLNTKVLNEPILIVRQKDLSLKAFFISSSLYILSCCHLAPFIKAFLS